MESKRDPSGLIFSAVGIVIAVALFVANLLTGNTEVSIAKALIVLASIIGAFTLAALLILAFKDKN